MLASRRLHGGKRRAARAPLSHTVGPKGNSQYEVLGR